MVIFAGHIMPVLGWLTFKENATCPRTASFVTRWNSMLAMLQQLHTQQRAINEYLCEYGTRTGSWELGFFLPRQWLLIKDACTILSSFEEATRLVSNDRHQ